MRDGGAFASGGHLVFGPRGVPPVIGAPRIAAILLGRDRERREIERVLDGARSGTSGCVALVGEPGIGKTALLDHAADEASDMRVLRARGIEAEAQVPFASLLELVRSDGRPVPDDVLEESDVIIPPPDLTFAEAGSQFTGDGLIPD